jgi:hypothetical protein
MKGERRSKKKGQSVEFADYRNYVIGDDLRFLHPSVEELPPPLPNGQLTPRPLGVSAGAPREFLLIAGHGAAPDEGRRQAVHGRRVFLGEDQCHAVMPHSDDVTGQSLNVHVLLPGRRNRPRLRARHWRIGLATRLLFRNMRACRWRLQRN